MPTKKAVTKRTASSADLNERFFRSAYRIRRVEEEVARVYPTDKVKSPVHLSIGQEAPSVAVGESLRPDDVVFGTYRGHALYLAKGGDLRKMVAELYGKGTGCAKGKGGSMHIVDVEAGVMGMSAVVATTIPHAVGYAYAAKLRKTGQVVVSVFGDGAVEEGAFHESLNFAALKRLPVVFVCENNRYAVHSHQTARQSGDRITQRAQAFGIPAKRIESGRTHDMHAAIQDAVAAARKSAEGPYFFEILTYRWKEHVGPAEDWKFGYRSESEAHPWIQNDEVGRLGDLLPPARRKKIQQEVESEIKDAFDYAESSPFPPESELMTDLFAEA